MSRFLLVGYGSIGRRHAHTLQQFDGTESLKVVSDIFGDVSRNDFLSELGGKDAYSIGFVCSAINDHLRDFEMIAPYCESIFIEKPVVAPHQLSDLEKAIADFNKPIFIGYCMRFHPVWTAAREFFSCQSFRRCRKITFTNKSNLINWRASDNSFPSSSISSKKGGNIFRELSHDFDLWLTLMKLKFSGEHREIINTWVRTEIGPLLGVTDVVKSAKIELELNSDVEITFDLSLASMFAEKSLYIECEGSYMTIDFLSGTISSNGQVVWKFSGGSNQLMVQMYTNQMKSILQSHKNGTYENGICSVKEGLETCQLIQIIEMVCS